MKAIVVLLILITLSYGIVLPKEGKIVHFETNQTQSGYLEYFLQNRMQQCIAKPELPRLPRSYYVYPGYFDNIPANERIAPSRLFKSPEVVPVCNNKLVQPPELDAYEFETELFLTTIGLNIYDGTVYSIALSTLGQVDLARDTWEGIIYAGETCQFGNIRADNPCKGLIAKGTCDDKDHTGNCGFCYGDGATNEDKTLKKENAWSFRMISDYWALMETVDLRCPEMNLLWTWNDYKPILGENSWANLVAPLQLAIQKFKTVSAIPADDWTINMALEFLPSLDKMLIPSVGAVYYSPRNVLGYLNKDAGNDVSTENNISVLSGLKMLRYILSTKSIHLDKLALINKLIDSITTYLRSTYDPVLGFFRQGGTYDPTDGWKWATGDAIFAVDCQTWLMTVVNPLLIDQWFGPNSAKNIWNKTKELGGYKYDSGTGRAYGVGFSYNTREQVFSGEWTLGAMNMLRVFARAYSDPSFEDEANFMRSNIERELKRTETIDGVPVEGVLYANKRYWIPFGWWANPLISTASTSWTVLYDGKYNPFYLGGAYLSDY